MDFCKHSKSMAAKNDFELNMVKPEDDSTLKNMITSSGEVYSTELLDSAIEDSRNKLKTLVSTMDSVISLMKEVEGEERAAEEAKKAKEEAARTSLEVYAKVDELIQAQQRAKEANDMRAREVRAQKSVLTIAMKELQRRVSSLLDDGDASLEGLYEMHKALEMRLTSALTKKELAFKEKLEIEASSREALAFQERQMDEVVEESKRLRQEAAENPKLQKLLNNRCHVVHILQGQISDKSRDVILLKKELEQGILQSRLSFSSQTPILASSSSSLTTSETPYEQQTEIMGSYKIPQRRQEKKVMNGNVRT